VQFAVHRRLFCSTKLQEQEIQYLAIRNESLGAPSRSSEDDGRLRPYVAPHPCRFRLIVPFNGCISRFRLQGKRQGTDSRLANLSRAPILLGYRSLTREFQPGLERDRTLKVGSVIGFLGERKKKKKFQSDRFLATARK